MKLRINGEVQVFEEAPDMLALLKQYDIKELTGIAIALNYQVIPKAELGAVQLKDGDEIEIVKAVQGG